MTYKGMDTGGVANDADSLKFSKFCHYFERNRIGVYYHSLSMQMVFISRADSLPLKRGDWSAVNNPGLMARLKERKLIVPAHYDETEELRRISDTFNAAPDIRVLYLVLTEHCNFNCSYCFIRQSLPPDYRSSFMSCRTTKLAIDRFSECLARSSSDKEKTIIFYGGEPLLNMTSLRTALGYIKLLKENGRLPQSLRLCLNTNGSLVTRGIAEYLKKHNVHVAVSIDGKADTHEAFRKYPDRRGTFEETMRGFRFLKKAGIEVSISCTAGPHNMKEMDDIARWFAGDFDIKAFGWNILSDPPVPVKSEAQYIKKLSTAALRCYEYCLEHGIYEDTVGRLVTAFVNNRVRPNNCAACGEQMVVSPEGKIGICYAFLGTGAYFDCSVDEPFLPENEPAFAEWRRRSPLNMEECFECAALGICGGGCPHEAFRRTGDIKKRDLNYCTFAGSVLEWSLWQTYRMAKRNSRATPNTTT